MTTVEFEKKWLKTFVPGLTNEQREKCYIDQYLWHAFSFKLIPADKVLVGDKAREAYEKADKEGAISICFWPGDVKETSPVTEKQKLVKTLDRERETYIVSRDWKWTYVSTHENDVMDLGPFFYERDNTAPEE
ncbi:MAG: DUF4275 family protein [Oscillospiraceae bacterium]|nr:DUF4275 family protein [Oscillospiraceae bacterium]